MSRRAAVVIVDRETILVELLIRVLKSGDLDLFGARSGEEALRLIELHDPDLVIIDPRIENGLDLLQSLSSKQSTKVLVLTESDEVRQKARSMGIDRVVDKGGNLETLVQVIRSSLGVETLSLSDEGDRILVVEDEEEVLQMLSSFLTNRGYSVFTARTGTEAMETVARDPSIFVVLLDVIIPEMGGIETLKEIMKRNPHPSVIMMTAIADREIAQQALKLGAADYILKPFNLQTIESSIAACLAHAEYRKRPWWKRLTDG